MAIDTEIVVVFCRPMARRPWDRLGRQDSTVILHLETITAEQRQAIARLGPYMVNHGIYLAGETAVALYFGHRRSVDLDWFSPASIPDPAGLAEQIRAAQIPINLASVERGTLHGELFGVRISVLEYSFRLLQPLVRHSDLECEMASLADLAAMKLLAIAQRGSKKDFVDVYALGLAQQSLTPMLKAYQEKFSVVDVSRILYSLTYFEDADQQPPLEMLWDTSWHEVKRTISQWVVAAAGDLT